MKLKRQLKLKLSQAGILHIVDWFRHLPAIVRWVSAGCTGAAPAPVKRRIISSYMSRYGLKEFVETGTHEGDTLAYIARDSSVRCSSIELSDHYYELARRRFSRYPNVRTLHGDSGALLPGLVKQLESPALFWLDGHYSGGRTARAVLDTPVSSELDAILESSIDKHVVLIDDARLFRGTGGYPDLGRLLTTLRDNGKYDFEVSADMIRLTPGAAEQ